MSETTPKTSTESAETGLVRSDSKSIAVRVGRQGVELSTLDEMYRWARFVSIAKLAPKGLDSPEQIMVATQMGMELGFSPMESLRSIVVINGLPGLRGEVAAARLYSSSLVAFFREGYENLPPAGTPLPSWPVDAKHVIDVERVGWPRERFEFTVGDAIQAKLWQRKGRDGQDTPWVTYPKRMLRWRNLGFVIKDRFPEVGHRLPLAEELIDLPAEAFPTRTEPARDVVDAIVKGSPLPRSSGVPGGRPARPTDPPKDPLLDSVAGEKPFAVGDVPVPEESLVDSLRLAIREEILRRTGGEANAAIDLERELTGGQGLDVFREVETLTPIADALAAHKVFGDSPEEP